MSAARAEVLGRIRAALGPSPAIPEVPRAYRGTGQAADVDRFAERVADYRADVHRVRAGGLGAALEEASRGLRLGVPRGLPWAPASAELVADDPPLPVEELDRLDGALTGCALGIAETGTIVLDGGARSGRRVLSLVPDLHLCVVEAAQVVAGVPDAIAGLEEAARAGRPITFVSGPSATSDIELERVEGVHGPRRLVVFVVA